MEHKHEPEVQLDGIIRCRECGEILTNMEDEIAKVDSALKANRILQEVAVAGNYRALSFEDGFVLYARDKNGTREEVAVKKYTRRDYRIVRRIVHTGGG